MMPLTKAQGLLDVIEIARGCPAAITPVNQVPRSQL